MKNLPKNWKNGHLSSLVERLNSGISIICQDIPPADGESAILKLNCVSGGRFDPTAAKRVSHKDIGRLSEFARGGHILISRSNTPLLVGACAFVPKDYPHLFLPDTLWQLEFRANVQVDACWLTCLLQSPPYRKLLQSIASGTSGSMKKLQKPSLLQIPIAIPTIGEQEQIGSIFRTLNHEVGTLEILIATKLKHKLGLMQRLLTGQMRFKEFKGERWRTIRLGDLLQEVDRYVTFDDDHTYRLASIRRRSEGLFFREALQGKDIKTKVMKTIRTGDFILSKMQVVHGAWGLVTPEFDGMFVSDSYISLVPKDGSLLKIEFLNYLSQMRLLRHMAYVCSHGVHIEKMTFNLEDFLHEKITIPPTLDEQTAIVGVLSVCDREIELLRKQLETLKAQKRGLMQKLLTGEVRVKINNKN